MCTRGDAEIAFRFSFKIFFINIHRIVLIYAIVLDFSRLYHRNPEIFGLDFFLTVPFGLLGVPWIHPSRPTALIV